MTNLTPAARRMKDAGYERAMIIFPLDVDRDESAALNAMAEAAQPQWEPISTAPKDGERFWGKVGDDAIAMLWHAGFNAFVSGWRRQTLAPGYTFEDGSTEQDHSPTVHYPTGWMPMPKPLAPGEPT